MNVVNGLEHDPEAFQHLVTGSVSLGAALFFTAFALVRCVVAGACLLCSVCGACLG
jgi:hypothetical protein